MSILARWVWASVLVGGWACTGGVAPVVIGGPGPGNGEPAVGSPPLSPGQVQPLEPPGGEATKTTKSGSSGSGVAQTGAATTTTAASSTGSGGGCVHCNDVLTGKSKFMSTNYCPGSQQLANTLFTCACSKCAADCTASCSGTFAPPSGACQDCGSALCTKEGTACQADM